MSTARERRLNRLRSRRWRQRQREANPRQAIACEHCGALFLPQRSTARFCSATCRAAAHRQRQQHQTDGE